MRELTHRVTNNAILVLHGRQGKLWGIGIKATRPNRNCHTFVVLLDFRLPQDERIVGVVGLFRVIFVGKLVVGGNQTLHRRLELFLFRDIVGQVFNQIHQTRRGKVFVAFAIRIDAPQFVLCKDMAM